MVTIYTRTTFKTLRFSHTMYLCVPYDSHYNQWVFLYTALADWLCFVKLALSCYIAYTIIRI
jgi:hypothetical protein